MEQRRLSVLELTQQILQMSEDGVYRESVFDVFQSLATKKEVRRAIAYAKHFGLGSVASLRDSTLGTYYQLDPEVYQRQKHRLKEITAWELERHQRLRSGTSTAQELEEMFRLSRSLILVLLVLSASLGVAGHRAWASAGLYGAMGAAALWWMQRWLLRRPSDKDLNSAGRQAESLRR